jgi:hypothetical protein
MPPNYAAKIQYTEQLDDSPLLDKKGRKYLQPVAGTFLYYGRAVDSTILVAINALATEQAKSTEQTLVWVRQFLDYCASQEEAVTTYHASNMILAVHSNAGYLNEGGAQSQAGGHFFLSHNVPNPPNNRAILNIAQIIKAVMSSAAEAELGSLFINAKEAVYIRQILAEMGHPQPPTPIQTNNSTAEGVIDNKIQPKRTKSMDMRFHWLHNGAMQQQFRFYWRPGGQNYADYYIKHYSPAHHRQVRDTILTRYKETCDLQNKKQVDARINQVPNSMNAQHVQAARVCHTG